MPGGSAGVGAAGVGAVVRILPMGDLALLVEADDLTTVLALQARLAPLVAGGRGIWASVEDVVPAARTILLLARAGTDLGALGRAVVDAARTLDRGDRPLDRRDRPFDRGDRPLDRGDRPFDRGDRPLDVDVDVEIAVSYDGPDVEEVARHTGLTPDEVVAAHTGSPWRVAFGGFAPGFAYLVGGDPRLEVPRRAEPRTRVPAGSVGLAGEFSGIYPRDSPGGWQLIGTTDAVLWDADRDPPALLSPGMTVRFVDQAAR